MSSTAKKIASKYQKELIKRSLEEELSERGKNLPHYLSLVEDYVSLWQIKEMLLEDIDKRGAVVSWQNGPNQKGFKKNESVFELTRVSRQMLKILEDLGLRASDMKAVVPTERL